MTRVLTVSGHAFVFGLHHDEARHGEGSIPRATLLVARDDRVVAKGIELTGADVEGVLAILLRIREKQREYEQRKAAPTEDESKAPPATQARTTGKRSKSTAK